MSNTMSAHCHLSSVHLHAPTPDTPDTPTPDTPYTPTLPYVSNITQHDIMSYFTPDLIKPGQGR